MPLLGRKRADVQRSYRLSLKATDGTAADLTGADSVTAELCAGPGSPTALELGVTIEDPPTNGTVLVTFPVSPALSPGEYSVFVTATMGGVALDAASDYTIIITAGVNTSINAMSTVRARIERIVVIDCGPLMFKVGLSTITGGANPDLAEMIAWAYRGIGLAPADPLGPSEAELQASSKRVHDIAELAKYRVLVACRLRWTEVTTRVSQGQVNSTDLRKDLDARISAMEQTALVKKALDTAGLSVTAGGIDMSDLFQSCEETGGLHT